MHEHIIAKQPLIDCQCAFNKQYGSDGQNNMNRWGLYGNL